MVTEQMVKDHLGIDYADDMVNRTITRLIKVADAVLKKEIGDDYPTDDPVAEELQLVIIDDLYSKRGTTAKVEGATRRMVEDFKQNLRMERRRKHASL